MLITKSDIKEIDLDLLINETIREGNAGCILFIVPTNRKLRSLKKEIIRLCPDLAVAGLSVETLGTLSIKLLKTFADFSELSEAASTVILKNSAADPDLEYFPGGGRSIPEGTLSRIKNVISEYKKNSISADHLLKEAEKLTPLESRKAKDITKIYKSFLQKCNQLRAFETGDIYRELLNTDPGKLTSGFTELFPEIRHIFISGFDKFYRPEVEIINRLAGINNAGLFLNFDYFKFNPLIFSHLDDCYQNFESKGFRQITDKSPSASGSFKEEIKQNLFAAKTIVKKRNYEDKICLIKAPSRAKEVELIAKEIKLLLTGENVSPSDICVVFNLVSGYSGYVRDIFTSYGLPVNLTDRIGINTAPPVISLIKLLEIPEGDFYFKDIFRAGYSNYLSLGGFDVKNLEKISSKFGIVSGRHNWFSSIDAALNGNRFDGDSGRDRYGFTPDNYRKAAGDLQKLAKCLGPFEKKMSYLSFVSNLEELVTGLNLPANILRFSGEKTEEHIKALSLFIETVKEVFTLLAAEDSSEHPLQFYLDELRTIASSTRFNVKEKPGYGVLVTSVEEIRGIEFDYLFIGGMCDGDFPTRYQPEVFSSGTFQKQENVHMTEERYKFYNALGLWRKKLWLSLPSAEDKTELEPSTFLKDFGNLFGTGEKTEKDFAGFLLNREEIGISYGQASGNGQEELIKLLGEHISVESEVLLSSIKINYLRREGSEAAAGWNGNIGGAGNSEIKEKLAEFRSKEYSVTRLENYAKCPFKFFAEQVLKLDVTEEPSEEPEAPEIGNLLHETLFKFYSGLRERNITLAGCSDEDFSKAANMLFEIAESILQKENIFSSPLAFWDREKIFGIEGKKETSVLWRFLLNERNEESGFVPSYFETGFGSVYGGDSDEILSRDEPVEIEGVKIRGKIDRIDLNDAAGSLAIVDYKTGNKRPTKDELWNGLALQLPVYLKVAAMLVEEEKGKTYQPFSMQIYGLKFDAKGFDKRRVAPSDKRKDDTEENLQLIEYVSGKIKEYVENISSGKFNLSALPDREDKICRYCDFKKVCRVQEMK